MIFVSSFPSLIFCLLRNFIVYSSLLSPVLLFFAHFQLGKNEKEDFRYPNYKYFQKVSNATSMLSGS
jgi:hypothetical protein